MSRPFALALVLLASAPALAQEDTEAELPAVVEEAAPPTAEAAEAPVEPQVERSEGERSLEASLRMASIDFDGVSFLGAQRSILTGVFETYCAVDLLIPPEAGFRALDFVLGLGCLLGATTSLVMGIRRLLSPKEGTRSRDRLVQFYSDRRTGSLDLERYEEALFEAARRDRRRRWVRFSLGVLELGAAATVAGLTGRQRIERAAGASIAIGTTIIAIMGLVNAWMRSPTERAADRHRAARVEATAW